jgi:hypothetical protein
MDPMEAIRQSIPEHDPQFQTLAQHMRQQQRKPKPAKDPNPESQAKPVSTTVESSDQEQPATATPPQDPSTPPSEPNLQGTELQELVKEGVKEADKTWEEGTKEIKEQLLPLNQPVPEPQPETVSDPSKSLEVDSVVPEPTPVVEAELEEDYNLIRAVREYCSPHSVAMVMKYMCEKSPETFPRFTSWDTDVVEPPVIVYAKLMSEGYIASIMPIVKMMLGTSIHNISWSARVSIGIAVYDTVRDLARMSA